MIKFNKDYFESRVRIAERLFEENLYEDCINYIEKTAFFGWHNFSGYYKSEKLEILLSKIQEKVLPEISIKKSEKKAIQYSTSHPNYTRRAVILNFSTPGLKMISQKSTAFSVQGNL
ncbi:hypothetical protein [Chryseobacterium sp. 3008163]|uniref:hypothetical protein n=1 Tax=Chryseobacterium sp. 3008163 TaxID=2478663 RepID=UPI000F0C5D01|nr:hypothetical protein [Chryseobacterium sp. 3008163]AYN00495.1 hypothetical protein EAG08_09365 [Chryseobacterium sp. 3008163]